MSIRRRRWRSAAGDSITPVDPLLDAAEATLSRGVRQLGARINADAKSFARAADCFKRLAQISLSTELLRQVVEAEGQATLAARESGALRPDWAAEDCKAQTPAGGQTTRLYLGSDGFMVPVLTEQEKRQRRAKVRAQRRRRSPKRPKLPPLSARKKGDDEPYREFKLVQFHDESMEHRLVAVTRGRCAAAGRIMRREAARIGFDRAAQRLGNVDGSPWIVGQIARMGLLLTGLCLDFYHLGEHVNTAKRGTFGPETEAGEAWAERVMHTAKHEGFEPFWEELLRWRGGQRRKQAKAEADGLLHYVSERKEMILYAWFLAEGWRISSSTTESECGAIPQRVKGPGKRWDMDNAEAVMALEAMLQSNLWEQYWRSCACGSG